MRKTWMKTGRGAVLVLAIAAGASTASAGGKSALFSFGKQPCGDGCGDTTCAETPCDTQARNAPVYSAPAAQPSCAGEARLELQPGCEVPCVSDGCDSSSCGGSCGGCGCCKDRAGLFKWHNESWYAAQAHLPPGERQHIHKGKYWLVEPRPYGIPEQPFWHKYHTNKTWPHPYNCVDRGAVQTTMAATVDRGWLNMTTLHAYHFDAQTHELNTSGRQLLQQILHTVPQEYRTAYVAAYDRPTAEARMASVKAEVMDMAGPGEQLVVLPRATTVYGRPAVEVDHIHRAALENMPAPVIGSAGGSVSGGASP